MKRRKLYQPKLTSMSAKRSFENVVHTSLQMPDGRKDRASVVNAFRTGLLHRYHAGLYGYDDAGLCGLSAVLGPSVLSPFAADKGTTTLNW